MRAVIENGIRLAGTIQAPPSKSEAIRAALLIFLSGGDPSEALKGFEGRPVCDDIKAALSVCRSLKTGGRLNVGASAALLRMALPVCLALFGEAEIAMDERLEQRGLHELEECLDLPLVPECGLLRVKKRLLPGKYRIDCTRSSQFLSGLLLALPLLEGESSIEIKGVPVSKGYADMTIAYGSIFGARYSACLVCEGEDIAVYPSKYSVPPPPYKSEGGRTFVSGDCSYAALFGAANHMGGRVKVCGISPRTLQPDIVFPAVAGYGRIDISGMPDLLPPLAAVACAQKRETVFTGVSRLAFKESSRAHSLAELINSLGGEAEVKGDELQVYGSGSLKGGECSAAGDHRIAMAAAVLAGICESPVELEGAECVGKSAQDFWNDYKSLGGEYEFVGQ